MRYIRQCKCRVVLARPEQGISAKEALRLLEEGNRRFVNEAPALKDAGKEKRMELLLEGQSPFAVIVGCSDSRVPPEVIFDRAIGDLFVIRTAGNVVDDIGLGSVEYALEHLHVPLVVVLGHESCGAVKATIEAEETVEAISHSIAAIVEKLQPSVQKAKEGGADDASLAERSVDENIRAVAGELIRQSPLVAHLVENERITIMGAKYFQGTGEVRFFE